MLFIIVISCSIYVVFGQFAPFPTFPTEQWPTAPTIAGSPTTPKPVSNPTPKPTTSSDLSVSTGYIDIAGLGIPLDVCVNAKNNTQDMSFKYTCNSAKNAIYYSEWDNTADCTNTASVSIQFATDIGGTHIFDCDTNVNYWVARQWGNETGTCAQNNNYWVESPVVTNICLPSMVLNNQPLGYSLKIHDCTSCQCSLSTYIDSECTNLFVDERFGDALCQQGECWTADPNVCSETQICPVATPKPTSSSNKTPAPTSNQNCVNNIDNCGYFVFGELAMPLNICLGAVEAGKKGSIMYSCTNDKKGIQIAEWESTLKCEGNPQTTIAFNQLLFGFSCADGIPDYFKTKVYGNQSGSCVQDENYWHEEAAVTNHCFSLSDINIDVDTNIPDINMGPSLKFTDCSGCDCTTNIYQDGECKQVFVSEKGSAPFCDQTGHCIISEAVNPSCSDKICATSPTPKPTTTAAPTNSDGTADCPFVNLAGFGFPLNVCIGGQNYTLNSAESIMYKCNDNNDGVNYHQWIGNTECDDSTATSTAIISLPTASSFNCYGNPCKYYIEKVYGNESGSCAQNENSWFHKYIVVDKCLGVAPEEDIDPNTGAGQISVEFDYDCDSKSGSYSAYFGNECNGDPQIYFSAKAEQCYSGQYHKVLSSNICSNAESNAGSVGVIVGSIIGVILVVLIGIGIAYYFFVYRKKQANVEQYQLHETMLVNQ